MSTRESFFGAVPNTLTLLPTYQCTAECQDCCFHSSPRIKGRIPQDRLLRYIDEAAQFPAMTLVVISGGEPFLLRRDLVELVQRITDRGLMSRIVSNGYWAVNRAGALATLKPLVAAGLREISFSTGDDHAKFVPLDRILTALRAALYCGLGVSLMIEETEGGTINRKTLLEAAQPFPEILDAVKSKALSLLESPWMKFTDDPAERAWNPARVLSRQTLVGRGQCTSIMASIVVTPDERLGMCCGLPREDIEDLNVGDLRVESMTSLFARHVNDIIKIWLAVEGPERLLAWAATKDPSIEWEHKYAHTCDVCRAVYSDPRVMRAIHEHGAEKFDELTGVFAMNELPFARDHRPTLASAVTPSPTATPTGVPAMLMRRTADGQLEPRMAREH